MEKNGEQGLRTDGTLAPTVYGIHSTIGSNSPASTAATSIGEEIAPASPIVLPTPPQSIMASAKNYKTGQLRAMADAVAKARKTGELPNSKASLEDVEIIVQDYKFLTQLQAVRGDPTKPHSREYVTLKVDIARHIKNRDDDLDDDAVREVAANRVANFKRVVSQEERFFEILSLVSRNKGTINPSQVDFAAVFDEIMDVIETSMSEAAGPLRLNTNRLSKTAHSMDSTAHSMDSTAHSMDSTAHSMDSTAHSMDSTAHAMGSAVQSLHTSVNLLNTSTGVLNSSVNVIGAQINGISAHAQNLGNLIRIYELVNQQSNDRVDGSLQNMHSAVVGLQAILNSIPAIIAQTVQAEVAPIICEFIKAQVHINGRLAHHNEKHIQTSSNAKKSSMKTFFSAIFKRSPSA